MAHSTWTTNTEQTLFEELGLDTGILKEGVNFKSGRIRRHHDLNALGYISMWQRVSHLNYTQDPCYYPVTKSLLRNV